MKNGGKKNLKEKTFEKKKIDNKNTVNFEELLNKTKKK